MHPTVIIGNGVAALVAAKESAAKGDKVTLIQNGRGWGGHFAGLNIDGSHFDAGMTIVEVTSTNIAEEPSLESYNPNVRNDVGRFFNKVEKYLQNTHSLRIIDTPKTFFRGSWHNDFLLCNHFSVLKSLTKQERNNAIAELKCSDSDDWRHAQFKIKKQNLHLCAPYEQTSRFNHGSTIHELLIAPYIKRLTNDNCSKISSLFHRRYWSPLYYPSTLLDGVKGKLDRFGETVIHYPEKGSFNSFISSLIDSVLSNENINVVEDFVESIHVNESKITTQKSTYKFSNIAWTSKLSLCQNALGIESIEDTLSVRSNLAFGFVKLQTAKIKKDFSIMFNCDPEISCYRITNQSNLGGFEENLSRLSIEFNADFLSDKGVSTADEIEQETINSLLNVGLIKDKDAIESINIKMLKNGLPQSSMIYEENTKANIDLAKEVAPKIQLFGDSSGIATRSFADQIVQGMKFAACGQA